MARRSFQGAWLTLAKLLTDIAYGGDYKEWGYDDFVAYCAEELNLKKRQVKKMMVSYNYIKSYRAELLDETEEVKAVPGYEAIADIYSAMHQEERYDQDKLCEIEAKVFGGEISGRDASRSIRDARVDFDDNIEKTNKNRRREISIVVRMARSLPQLTPVQAGRSCPPSA